MPCLKGTPSTCCKLAQAQRKSFLGFRLSPEIGAQVTKWLQLRLFLQLLQNLKLEGAPAKAALQLAAFLLVSLSSFSTCLEFLAGESF